MRSRTDSGLGAGRVRLRDVREALSALLESDIEEICSELDEQREADADAATAELERKR
jgi:hypothetical protein